MNRLYQGNPDIERISVKLHEMNDKHFYGMLTIIEPYTTSLTYTNEYVFGVNCLAGEFLCDKVPVNLLLNNEEDMEPELLRCMMPWFKDVKMKCDLARLELEQERALEAKKREQILEHQRYLRKYR